MRQRHICRLCELIRDPRLRVEGVGVIREECGFRGNPGCRGCGLDVVGIFGNFNIYGDGGVFFFESAEGCEIGNRIASEF